MENRKNDLEARQRLMGLLEDQGYVRVDPPVLQPIETFLELSGEDIRRRIFTTQNETGEELCLRPEFTIPVCRLHQQHSPEVAGDYAYIGPVFRAGTSGQEERIQAGIESIGRRDIAAVDAEVVTVSLEGLKALGCASTKIRLGDMNLTHAFLDALKISAIGKRRILRAMAANRPLDTLSGDEKTYEPHAGLLAAIQGQDPKAVRVFVEDVLSIAGISQIGGRSAGEIAERFLGKATSQANGGESLDAKTRQWLERYRAISGSPDSCASKIRALIGEAGLESDGLEATLDLLDERTGFMAARKLPVEDFVFSCSFVRNLDYYTGFIFEIYGESDETVLVGGGRYDTLLQYLGSKDMMPAVGCAFWLERCAQRAGRGDAA